MNKNIPRETPYTYAKYKYSGLAVVQGRSAPNHFGTRSWEWYKFETFLEQ